MHSTAIRVISIVVALVILGSSAFAELPCSDYKIENITEGFTGDSESPSISADGRFIAFESQTEITEVNPGGTYQIFIYDTLTGKFSQITDDENLGSVAPSISGDGTKVAFVSGADIKGNNPDGLNLIYLYDIDSGEYSQVTTEGNSFEPSVNSDGSQIVFTSNMGPNTGAANIFIYDSLSATTTKISDETEGWSDHPKISGSGKFVVYQSNPNISGPDAGKNSEIYLFDVVSTAVTPITLSGAELGSLSPSISSEGRFTAFQSDANLNNQNQHGVFNIYLYDTTDRKLAQITKEPGAGSAGASINGDGTLIAFQSSGDFSSNNPEGNIEIFLYDIASDEFVQITDSKSETNTSADINADGARIVFTSEASAEGNSEIYLASCAGKDISGISPDLLNKLILIAAVVFGLILLVRFRRKKQA